MTALRLSLIALILIACAPLPKANTILPRDVTRFIDRRDLCEHFMGEEAYNAERLVFLNTALARTCTGSNTKLKKLRIKYGRNAMVINALKNYDGDIEPETQRAAVRP
jgi:hypothetical protein